MPAERIHFLTHVGEIPIRKRKGSKRMSIRINPAGDVMMTIPYLVSFNNAVRFLEEKQDWIIQTKKKLEERKKNDTIYDENNLPRTKYHEFIITRAGKDELSFELTPGLCEIFIPDENDIRSGRIQEWIRKAFTETLRKEAKIVLVNRCKELAAINGFRINEIRVKNMKTRWGSCSTKGNINLNIHLMQLPDYLVDYVIFHELVHILHPNHGPDFWNELDRYVGNSKNLAKEIRNYGHLLHD